MRHGTWNQHAVSQAVSALHTVHMGHGIIKQLRSLIIHKPLQSLCAYHLALHVPVDAKYQVTETTREDAEPVPGILYVLGIQNWYWVRQPCDHLTPTSSDHLRKISPSFGCLNKSESVYENK